MPVRDLGTAALAPTAPVVAGSLVALTLTYVVGHPIDDSGSLKVCFRYAGDFGTPQFSDPAAPNYCTVRTTGDCRLVPQWDPTGHVRPWFKTLRLDVTGGFLASGDEVIVVFGDRRGGSPGWQMQTFCETTFEFKTLVDVYATRQYRELPASPTLAVVAGPAARAVALAPSQVVAGAPFVAHLRLEDAWGNPVGAVRPVPQPGLPQPGVETVTLRDDATGLTAVSNPIRVAEAPPAAGLFWADLHGQSEETIGTNSLGDYYRFARDVARLDAAAHQGNDFQISDAFWQQLNAASREHDAPGRFVTFPGYEWSGNTPLGGDRNVFFAAEGGPVHRSSLELVPGGASEYPVAATAAELFARLRAGAAAGGPAPFVYAHVGGRYADLAQHDPELEWAVEVHSAWGTFEWLVDDALARGQRVAIVANSDDHKGRPGASHPGASRFGSYGGLTGLYAPRLDRDSVRAALRARHCFATTGQRALLDVWLTTPDGRRAAMGDVITAGDGCPRLAVQAAGTAPIESLEVRRGTETLHVLRPYGSWELGRRVKVVWSGAACRGRAREVAWDGELEVEGNRIVGATPLNFWNAAKPLRRVSAQRLAWQSVTTGGLTGVILELAEATAGRLRWRTTQGEAELALAEAGVEPRRWEFGGLGKRLEVYRLPPVRPQRELSFAITLPPARPGDNAFYVRVAQEDGQLAWSSPIYVTG